MCSQVDKSSWYCYVVYSNSATESVPLASVKVPIKVNNKRKKVPFDPKNVDDFDPKKEVKVRTNLDSPDQKFHFYGALVLRIAESKELLEKSLKKNKPKVTPAVVKVIVDSDVTDQESSPEYNADMVEARENAKEKRINKGAAETSQFKNLLGISQAHNKQQDSDNSIDVKRLQALLDEANKKVERQQEQLRQKEEELAKAKQVEDSVKASVKASVQEEFNKWNQHLEDTLRQFKTGLTNDISKFPRYSDYVADWVNMLPVPVVM